MSSMLDKAKIVCLLGPTASGKTQLAIDLVQRHPFEIISVDSAMVYRGLNIGTAKPTADILKMAPHRLIDIRDPADAYSAAQFRVDAVREIEDILQQGKIPLLVGGTMLYFHALQKGLSELPSADSSVRDRLTAEAEQIGWAELHNRLAQIDPVAAARIHPHDAQRIQRALEVFEITQKNITDWHSADAIVPADYEMTSLAIAPSDRSILHERIEARFLAMLEEGFIDEVKTLVARGDLTSDMPSMRSVGYRQVWEFLADTSTYDEMCAKGIIATRQLAKRQLTWLRNWSQPISWVESMDVNLLSNVQKILRNKTII
jgi:tRNA dimethylallyltransferase